MNMFGYNCNGVEMAGDTYSFNTTLCWVLIFGSNIIYLGTTEVGTTYTTNEPHSSTNTFETTMHTTTAEMSTSIKHTESGFTTQSQSEATTGPVTESSLTDAPGDKPEAASLTGTSFYHNV